MAKLARLARRECGRIPDVIARSEATKQSILSLCGTMDCFAFARNDGLFEIRIPSHLSSAQKRQALEQMDVLFVLQKRAMQRRDQLARVALP